MKNKIKTTWKIRTYDVWGNEDDGFEVNDVYGGALVELDIQVETHNAGTPREFMSATPSDAQIRKVFGLGKKQIRTDGDDTDIYVNLARNDYPVGEMHCTSHSSLSPVRPYSESQ